MNGGIRDVDAQRARWRRYRDIQGLTVEAGQNFGTGGLGRHADDVGLRVLFIPSDPEADAVPLNGEVLEWLKGSIRRPTGDSRSAGVREGAASAAHCLSTSSIEKTLDGRDILPSIGTAASRSE